MFYTASSNSARATQQNPVRKRERETERQRQSKTERQRLEMPEYSDTCLHLKTQSGD